MTSEAVGNSSPKKWWQWVLMYPTIIVTLIGAVPQYMQWGTNYVYELPFDANLSNSENQSKAWRRNRDCLIGDEKQEADFLTKYYAKVTACPSGDLLVTLRSTDEIGASDDFWIIGDDRLNVAGYLALPGRAHAQQTPAAGPGRPPPGVVDIKIEGRIVKRRIRLPNGSCVDEIIDSYTGRRKNRVPAKCQPFAQD